MKQMSSFSSGFVLLLLVGSYHCQSAYSEPLFDSLMPNSLDVSLPPPMERVSFKPWHAGHAHGVRLSSPAEENGTEPCNFENELHQPAWCSIEAEVHKSIPKYVTPADTVIEAGARYGTTSCALAAALNNSGLQVAIDPDEHVWEALIKNRHAHNCRFWLIRGTVSARPMHFLEAGYATRSVSDEEDKSIAAEKEAVAVAPKVHFTFEELKALTGISKFTVFMIDCEGCIETFIPKDDKHACEVLKHVRVIFLEGDMSTNSPDCTFNCVNYTRWEERLYGFGFDVKEKTVEPLFSHINNYVFVRMRGPAC